MTDREMLELAAKAANLDCVQEADGGFINQEDRLPWNPLSDPADALRLAVHLEMRLEISDDMTAAFAGDADVALEHTSGASPLAATMRAIVRAAAEIGKEMK